MGVQLIICVETNEKTKSDYIYIKQAIEWVYKTAPVNVRFSPVYMDGKGNYKSRKVEKRVQDLIRQYQAASKSNISHVLYCVDCDDYDRNPSDRVFLDRLQEYCNEHCFRFVWFCRDIEHVFLGRQISDNEKRKEADGFAKHHLIEKVDISSLRITKYSLQKSNLCTVLDDYLLTVI